MSVAITPARSRRKGEVTQQTIQKMLDENHHLIQSLMDYQSKGKTSDCTQNQQILHRNLVYLATIADSNQNMQSLLPAPYSQDINMGPVGSGQSLHTQGNLYGIMATSLPPTYLIQGQMSPSHSSMQPPEHTPLPPSSVSLPVSSHGSAVGYSQSVASSQSVQIQSQGQNAGSYVSHGNMGMQSNQEAAPAASWLTPQYTGADESYSEQFGHAQNTGHGEHPCLQPSYSKSSYERTFEDSSQHYCEGGNNAQYSQQQASYQQDSGHQKPFTQQLYPTQQRHTGQQQAYGPGLGSSSQYSSYQQGQGQQYSVYRPGQTGSSGQAPRPYIFEQGRYGNYEP